MRKRKERVEKWREEQRKKAMENIGELKKEIEEMKQGKKWSLEDDDGISVLYVTFTTRLFLMIFLLSLKHLMTFQNVTYKRAKPKSCLGFQHFKVLLRLTNWRDFFMKKNDTVIKTDCNYLGRLTI